jgi:dihydroflavonol-4-reductase
MRIFVTGATGFLGGAVVKRLLARGDEVVAYVRNPKKGRPLEEAGCELALGDLSNTAAMRAGMEGCDAVIHGAAIYSVGVTKEQCREMHEANVEGTVRAMAAALDAKVPRVVYVSTIVAFGDTGGLAADETFENTGAHVSCYEETKYTAHVRVKRMMAERGLPCVVIQPAGIYGPNDHSELGDLLRRYIRNRLPAMVLPETAVNLVYLDDAADGVILGLDKGRIGESYIIGGENTTMRDALGVAAELLDRKPPKLSVPTPLLKLVAPAAPLFAPPLGLPPNLKEAITHSSGPTWWATSDKAKNELGYEPRSLREGMRDLLIAEGALSPAHV